MAQVVTYALAYGQHHGGVELCDACADAGDHECGALGEVQHGKHWGECEGAQHPVDVAFDAARDVRAIRYRLAPIDVGWDLRAEGAPVAIDPADDPIRVSYATDGGDRRVISGRQAAVLERLRRKGFRFLVQK